MKDRFGRADYRFLAVCLALLAATTWFSVRNFYRAFPEASIDFRVNRAEGQSLAAAVPRRQRYDTAGYRQASSFTFDDDAKTFLEREAGLEQANRIMGTRVRLWRWSYRWFRPLQKEEFRVDITPRGELAGFRHEIARRRRRAPTPPPTRPAPSPRISSARACSAIPPRSNSSKSPKSPARTAPTAPTPGRSAISTSTTPPTASK